MNKNLFISFIILITSILFSYNTLTACCKSSDNEIKSCCNVDSTECGGEEDSSKTVEGSEKDDCEKGCTDKGCCCHQIHTFTFNAFNVNLYFFSEKELKFFSIDQSKLSAGFDTSWLPPKVA